MMLLCGVLLTYLHRHLPAVGVVQHAALQRQGARQSAAVTCTGDMMLM